MVTKQSKVFFVVLSLVVLLAVIYTYYDTIVLKRFPIFTSEEEIPDYSDFLNEVRDLTNSYVR